LIPNVARAAGTPWSTPILLSSPLLVGLRIRRAEAVMGRNDPARGVTDRGYERRLLKEWERFVHGAGLPSGVVPDVVGQSWMRCRSSHVDPALEHAPDALARLLRGDTFGKTVVRI